MEAREPIPSESTQPSLFAPGQLPDAQVMVEAAKRYAHNGRTTCKDEERAEAIVRTYLELGSLLGVSRRFSISPNTVKSVIQVWEDAGKMDDTKQRLSRKLGVVVELSADRIIEKLVEDKLPPNVLPIVFGVASDKKANLDGEPTQRMSVSVDVEVRDGDLIEYLRARGIHPPIDVQSTVLTDKTQ